MKIIKKGALLLAAVFLFSLAAVGCGTKKDASVMKLGGIDVRYDVYKFAVLTERKTLETKYGKDALSGEVPDEIKKELRDGAIDFLRNIYAVLSLAPEYGVTEDAPAVVDSANRVRLSDVAAAGGEKEFLALIGEEGMTDEVYSFITRASVVSDELYYAMINQGAINSDEGFVRAFLEGDGCVRVKQVLVKNDERSDEEAKKLAEKVAGLAASGADFDELISEYNEDMSMFGGSQGYYLMRGVMYREFEDAAFSLDVGEASGVVRTPAGYSVIKRYEKDESYMNNHIESLKKDYFASVFALRLEERAASLEITDSALLDRTDDLSLN
ncbi:MAG: peptidylprolyl isomerase [Clostridia bacterium]|nr:peptidylprolyl isomerase [Clostridia bacterium]